MPLPPFRTNIDAKAHHCVAFAQLQAICEDSRDIAVRKTPYRVPKSSPTDATETSCSSDLSAVSIPGHIASLSFLGFGGTPGINVYRRLALKS